MKKIVRIPENINEITLGQYQKFQVVCKDLEGEFLRQRTIEVFCGLAFHEVLNMKQKDINYIYSELETVLQDKGSFKNRFEISGEEFGFIPNLDEITSGEFADLSAYIGDEQRLHLAMAVMFRPIIERQGDKYDIMSYNGTKDFGEIMKFMPLGCALGAMVFFWSLAKDLQKHILLYTMEEKEDRLRKELETLTKNMDSMLTSTRWRKAISLSLKK